MKKLRDRQDFKQITLKNGIEIYYYPEKSPISLATIIVPFGSNHNAQTKFYGSAHLLEHMVLLRSKLYPQLESFSKKVDSVGGYINGSTYNSETYYSLGAPDKNFNALWAGFISQIFDPIFRQEDIIKQTSIIFSEKKRERYYPAQSELDQYIFTKWINDCPLSVDQIYGHSQSLKKLTPGILKKIHQSYFHKPMRILLAGNINVKRVARSLENLQIKKAKTTALDLSLRWMHQKYHQKTFKEINRWEYRFGGLQEVPVNDLQKFALISFITAFISNHYRGVLYQWLREDLGWSYELNTSLLRRGDRIFWHIYIPLQNKQQVNIVRKELIDRIRNALKDSEAIADKVHKQIGRASFYYQTLGEILNDGAYDLSIYNRIISEKEWLKYIENCNNSELLVKIWDELVEKNKIGEFVAIPSPHNGS